MTSIRCALQVFCRALNSLGCILPSERTSASVAAVSVLLQHGVLATQEQLQSRFSQVKSRMKQLHKAEPPLFVQVLPATPAGFVKSFRAMAIKAWEGRQPPITCPLSDVHIQTLLSRIKMRNYKPEAGAILTSLDCRGVDRQAYRHHSWMHDCAMRCRPPWMLILSCERNSFMLLSMHGARWLAERFSAISHVHANVQHDVAESRADDHIVPTSYDTAAAADPAEDRSASRHRRHQGCRGWRTREEHRRCSS